MPDLNLRGVVPPLVTPFDESGEVDEPSLRRLVDLQLGAGVDGLFVGGSTGEVALLDQARLDRAVRVVVDAAGGAVPVLAGAVDTGTARVVERARGVVRAGAGAVVVTPPFYVRPHPDEIVRHYRDVAASLDVPVVAYDIPSAVGTRLTPEVVGRIAASGSVVALKDSSGDLATFRDNLRVAPDLPQLTGSELFADVAVQVGAAGIVPGLGNVDPDGYVRLYRAAAGGDAAVAAAEQERLARLFRIASVADPGRIGFTAGALGAFKEALRQRGVLSDARTAEPLLPLDDAERQAISALLSDAGLARPATAAAG